MTRFPDAALTGAITQFHDEMQRIALAAARDIFDREFARTLAELRASEPRKREPPPPRPGKAPGRSRAPSAGAGRGARASSGSGPSPRPGRPARVTRAGRTRASAQLSLPLAAESAPAPTAAAPPAPSPSTPAASAAASGATSGAASTAASISASISASGKRVRWTRETIISELANWMLSGTAIDGAFMSRHGPPGLVSATRRIFGRFEAAMNLAGLHIAKLYPDGPPDR